ncbi:hypothetical protein [Streptomyces sp. NPDC004267]|uniref:hypothetical protein n=1 Tax=Streptomyces sp. NPDC004267 TaxID=3364694 RepID=UPI0036B0E041
MTTLGSLITIRAEVTTGGMKHGYCRQVPLHGFTEGVSAEAWRTAVHMATRELFTKGLICGVCADQATTDFQDRVRHGRSVVQEDGQSSSGPSSLSRSAQRSACISLARAADSSSSFQYVMPYQRSSATRSTTSARTPHLGAPGPAGCESGCAAVRLSVEVGRQEFPLTEDLLTVYAPGDRLRLIATVTPRWSVPYAALEVLAQQWTATDLWWRHRLMETVVGNLGLGRGDRRSVRTFIWDGKREIPYRYNWTRPASQPGR